MFDLNRVNNLSWGVDMYKFSNKIGLAILLIILCGIATNGFADTLDFKIPDYIPERFVDLEWRVDGSFRLQGNYDKRKIDVLIVDYIQLVSSQRKQNKEIEVGDIALQLKNLAKELNIPILALSQLSRAVELRINKMPQLSDLRDSGQLEQHADEVYFLYTESEEESARVDLVVSKSRNGSRGAIPLIFEKQFTQFKDL